MNAMAAGVCDICGASVGDTGGSQISAAQMQQVAQRGFDPYQHYPDLGGTAAVFGVSLADQLASWREQVQESSTDWRLCTECTGFTENYLPADTSEKEAAASATVTSLGQNSVRRDQFNDQLRQFFHVTNMDFSLAECTRCSLLLPNIGLYGGFVGGFAVLNQNSPQAVNAFISIMVTLLGDEFAKGLDPSNVINLAFSVLKAFHLTTFGDGEWLCPACYKAAVSGAK